MRKTNALLSFALLFLVATAIAQTPAPAPAAPGDYSQEPFVIERYQTKVRFEKDGTSRREHQARIKVRTDLGVQRWGQLVFPYSSANEKREIQYVRVVKPDGSIVNAPLDSVQELTPAVTRDAPMYTDYREMHLTVPSLRPGDVLEFSTITTTVTPLARGQFWFEYEFYHDIIALDEQVEVNVPAGVTLKMKTEPGYDAQVRTEGDRKIYFWKASVLRHKTDEERKQEWKERRKAHKDDVADIQLSTFQDWAQVGAWYRDLERERVHPDEAVRAKALELTKGKRTDMEKVEALYGFVSNSFRYVSLSFGLGRFQPHAASEIFANRYGDCKDKHTLLAGMLEAVGLKGYAALIHSSRKLDPDMPSPAQFDHVITVVPLGKEEVWLDTTPEVAAFRHIYFSLRNKKALVVPEKEDARLETVPSDIPFPNSHVMEVDGAISELGKFTARVKHTMRGDDELYYRVVLRQTPEADWGDRLKETTGFAGEITDVKAGDLNDISKPFELSYTVTSPNLMPFGAKHAELQLPVPYMIGVPEPPDDDGSILSDEELGGAPSTMTFHVKLKVPENYSVAVPVAMTLKRDYANYEAKYTVEKNLVTADRTLSVTKRELPPNGAKSYYAFARAVRSDQEQTMALQRSAAAPDPKVPTDAKVDELLDTGFTALRSEDANGAIVLFKAATDREPKNWRAWAGLGGAYADAHRFPEAADALRKVIEIDPYSEFAYKSLGGVLLLDRKLAEAEDAFRKQMEITPLDVETLRGLVSALIEERKFKDAIEPAQKMAQLAARDAGAQTLLGHCYLENGDKEKAVAAFDRAVEVGANPSVWNDVAYELARFDLQLDRAQQYAESAVTTVSAELRNLDIANASMHEIGQVSALAAYWDTLGWVYFHRGDLDKAEKYVRASWQVADSGEVADHLAEILEKRGNKDEAARMYAISLSVRRSYPEAKPRLVALVGEKKADEMMKKAAADLDASRTLKLPNSTKVAGSAEFLLLLAPGAKFTGVKFLSGDDALKGFAATLSATKHDVIFPDDVPTKVLRRATLKCTKEATDCDLVLLTPENTASVD